MDTFQYIELTFDLTGQLVSLKNRKTGKLTNLKQEFLVYTGMGFISPVNQSSGAYIFRPNGTTPLQISNVTSIQYIEVCSKPFSPLKTDFKNLKLVFVKPNGDKKPNSLRSIFCLNYP